LAVQGIGNSDRESKTASDAIAEEPAGEHSDEEKGRLSRLRCSPGGHLICRCRCRRSCPPFLSEVAQHTVSTDGWACRSLHSTVGKVQQGCSAAGM